MTVPPTVCTTPPTGCVTGASGESCAVPSDWTRSPALTTVLPACVTTLPVLPTVTPSGLSTLPILPSPSRTPTPSVATVSPAFITTSPVAFCAASGTTGRFASLTCCPISLTALPVATTVLPAPSVTLAVGVVSTEAAGVGVAGGGVTLLLPFGEAPLPEPPDEQPASSASRAPQAMVMTDSERSRCIVDLMICLLWCPGVLMCWCAGVLVCWCAGVLVCSKSRGGLPMSASGVPASSARSIRARRKPPPLPGDRCPARHSGLHARAGCGWPHAPGTPCGVLRAT
ncbi:hypothetical protein D3C81_1122110 [compost metagenome]